LKTRAMSALLMSVESVREIARGRGIRPLYGHEKAAQTR
jgi:hypothetical protein